MLNHYVCSKRTSKSGGPFCTLGDAYIEHRNPREGTGVRVVVGIIDLVACKSRNPREGTGVALVLVGGPDAGA